MVFLLNTFANAYKRLFKGKHLYRFQAHDKLPVDSEEGEQKVVL
jgi:hypothetical protein